MNAGVYCDYAFLVIFLFIINFYHLYHIYISIFMLAVAASYNYFNFSGLNQLIGPVADTVIIIMVYYHFESHICNDIVYVQLILFDYCNLYSYHHSPTGASISPGLGVSKQPGPGFPYYSSKAGSIEVQKRNTGRRGSRYTSNESSCRVEYESTTFFEVNTHFKYFSVDKPLYFFISSL